MTRDEAEADTGPITAPGTPEARAGFAARSRAFGGRVRGEFTVPFRRETYARAEQRRPLYARLLYGLSIPIVVLWVLLACGLNAAGPQLEKVIEGHALSFLPDEASSVQALSNMGKYFGNGGTNNFVAVLAEGEHPFGAEMHSYYARLMEKFKADKKHVITTIDLWSDPSFAPAFESQDRKASFSYLNLGGNMGTALAMESTQAVRDIVKAYPPPAGVKIYVTGPSAVVNDELLAINRSILPIIFACAICITIIMSLTYRSLFTAAMPLLVVAVALVTARPIVALLGQHEIIGISIFASSLLAGIVLGAGTDYGIFLLGRYQEARRAGEDPTTAYYTALFSVQRIIFASGLTVAGATACMTLTRLAAFSTSGLPCTIGILTALAAALTLGPALLAIGCRLGLYEPRGERAVRRWRRIATHVVRWPGPVLAGSLAVLALAILVLPTYVISYNERAAQPANTEANLGLDAADRHLPPNMLNPNLLFVESDHDMRNSADLIALAKLTSSVYSVEGVQAVQGITRPLISPLPQGTLTYQGGYIGERMAQIAEMVSTQLNGIAKITGEIDQLSVGVKEVLNDLQVVQRAAELPGGGVQATRKRLVELLKMAKAMHSQIKPVAAGGIDAAGQLVDMVPDCREVLPCNAALTGLTVLDGLNQAGARKFEDMVDASQVATQSLPRLVNQVQMLDGFLNDAKQTLAPIRGMADSLLVQMNEVTAFLREIADTYMKGDPGGYFFLPSQAFESPLFQSALSVFFSPDGKITRMLVMGDVNSFSQESMDYSAKIIPAAKSALKGTSLGGSTVSIGGAGGTLLNIAAFAKEDFLTSAVAAFAFVFCVVLLLLRSFVAAVAVVGTVGLSFLSAWGLSVAIWQYGIGLPLHWAVAPCSFIFLVAVGADYNLLLVARFKEEIGAGIKTGIVRAMVGTGSVVTTAGLIFGFTMFALIAGYSSTLAQIGTTVGVGLLLDTLVVRSLVIPSIATLLGRWFWWPIRVSSRPAREAGNGAGSNKVSA
ncbi:RND family transporter [Mycobacterium sp. NPDC050853]|uniref:MMPL/RND family transporter n=1 Tax=Mycobacterium sp. NPDC050853 TaxID=3155160 RepID=UPI0033EB7772